MLIGKKDLAKLFATTIVICCAVFVCTLFLNYNLDIAAQKSEITTPQALIMYDAQVSTGKVVSAVSGGCLVLTTAVLLIFYVKNYIDSHGKELGILKALGYSDFQIAGHFWVFGLSVLAGSVLALGAAYAYMPHFYRVQNDLGLFSEFTPGFHPFLFFGLLLLPAAFFSCLAILYALFKLKKPVIHLLKEIEAGGIKRHKREAGDGPFLKVLRKEILSGRKILTFFMAFSAFCFSAMVQMSLSMKQLASESMGIMMLAIGLILAFMTLFLSLTSVLKANGKTLAMMKVFGYSEKECASAVLNGYRPVSWLGFIIGTGYQYGLLRIMVDIVFADYDAMPEFHFNTKGLVIAFAAFVVVYEAVIYCYSRKIAKMPVKSVMLE